MGSNHRTVLDCEGVYILIASRKYLVGSVPTIPKHINANVGYCEPITVKRQFRTIIIPFAYYDYIIKENKHE